MLCTEEAARAIHPGMHGTTFGGGPLACAVALAVINTIEQNHLLEYVTDTGTYFRKQLIALAKKHSAIIQVRGIGLMLAIDLDSADLAKQVVADMLARRILINRTSETVLRFLPPYILKKEHIDEAITALDEIFTEHAPQAAASSTIGAKHDG